LRVLLWLFCDFSGWCCIKCGLVFCVVFDVGGRFAGGECGLFYLINSVAFTCDLSRPLFKCLCFFYFNSEGFRVLTWCLVWFC